MELIIKGFEIEVFLNGNKIGTIDVPHNKHNNLRQALTLWSSYEINSAVKTAFPEPSIKTEILKKLLDSKDDLVLEELEKETEKMFLDSIKNRKWFGNTRYVANPSYETLENAGELTILAKISEIGEMLAKRVDFVNGDDYFFTGNPATYYEKKNQEIFESLLAKFRGLCVVYAKEKKVFWWNASNFSVKECLLVYQVAVNLLKLDQEKRGI